MTAKRLNLRLLAALTALAAPVLFSGGARADIYDEAVAHAGRSDKDKERDAIDHPAEVLRLSGIKPGMTVGDVMGANGYYAELVSYIVGPKGHVYILNNVAWDNWSENRWRARIEGRLPNVEHRTENLERLDLPDHFLNAVLLIKVYHDLYWKDPDPKDQWPTYDVPKVLHEVSRVLKPGGTLLLVDHSAKPGIGSTDVGTLHRIDEAYAQVEFEKLGFKLKAKSDALRRPDDPRDAITFEGPMLGKTDRFLQVFSKM